MAGVLRIGSASILPLLDAVLVLPTHEAAPGIAPEILAAESPGLEVRRRSVHVPVVCHLVRSAGLTILVDTGVGPRQRPGWPLGTLDAVLAEAGVRPADVDIVLSTHLHGDHVGWNTTGDAPGPIVPFFPNARYVFQRREWEYWIRPDRLAAVGTEHLAECVVSLADRAEIADAEAAITPEVTFVATPGHTPGHVAIGLSSGGERALIVGDATHFPAQLAHPDWSPLWDLDPLQAARTRAALFDELERDAHAALVTSHWPFPGMGRVVRVAGRRIFVGADLRA